VAASRRSTASWRSPSLPAVGSRSVSPPRSTRTRSSREGDQPGSRKRSRLRRSAGTGSSVKQQRRGDAHHARREGPRAPPRSRRESEGHDRVLSDHHRRGRCGGSDLRVHREDRLPSCGS